MPPPDLTDPIETALRASEALERAGLPAALYGGLALAAYGRARETRDADFAVVGVPADQAQSALEQAGLSCDLGFRDLVLGGARVSRITIFGRGSVTGLNTVDLVEPRDARYAAAVLARALTGELRGRSIRLVAPEDFVLLKVLATRGRDVDDAASVLAGLGPALDGALLDREARLLAVTLPDHDVLARLERARAIAAGGGEGGPSGERR